ncbi:MAG TPA: radical SAM family heme chaperone HemW [Thermoanaerobaculia bacterium]|jgi:oxygen-independent coproporphyrinogen-3 oxidase|nr:radical SAM family heme chaperone HemW [Thermoanaerobaculia bacterium]
MRGRGAGLYVHLPYCASRCGYCAFVVTTDGSSRDRYLGAVEREAALLEGEADAATFDSIYLGGGTPSLLPPAAVARLVEVLRSRFRIDVGAEVTLEANPEDVGLESVPAWRDAGVTRVSVGIQSLADVELEAVGRRHDAAGARAALELLAGSGLSISGDLILGLPDQTRDSFRESVAGLADSGVDHVSVYLLETEKSKTIEEDRRHRPARYLSDDAQAELWLEMGESLAGRGLAHYEISNWARPGREARHNVKYWTRSPTLGLGVSAHELWAGHRRANVSNLETYLGALGEGRRPVAFDLPVEPAEVAREELFLGLRLAAGVPCERVEAFAAAAGDVRLWNDYEAWLAEGILQRVGDRVRFSERGYLVSNEVLARFV